MPGQYYVYIPFARGEDGDLYDATQSWRRQMSYGWGGRKLPRKLQHGQGAMPLATLPHDPATYTLYVIGHGSPVRRTLANTRYVGVKGRRLIEPAALASQMQRDGLPKNIVNLKLWACYGGVRMGRYFYHALITRGFERVKLSAYTLPLLASPGGDGHKRAMELETKDVVRPSSVRVQWP